MRILRDVKENGCDGGPQLDRIWQTWEDRLRSLVVSKEDDGLDVITIWCSKEGQKWVGSGISIRVFLFGGWWKDIEKN